MKTQEINHRSTQEEKSSSGKSEFSQENRVTI